MESAEEKHDQLEAFYRQFKRKKRVYLPSPASASTTFLAAFDILLVLLVLQAMYMSHGLQGRLSSSSRQLPVPLITLYYLLLVP